MISISIHCSSPTRKQVRERRHTLFNAVLLGSFMVGIFLLARDALDTLVKVVLVASALGGFGAF